MSERMSATATLTLHGFPDLGLASGNRQVLALHVKPGISARALCIELLETFGERLRSALGPMREAGCPMRNLRVFVDDRPVDDIDEPLDGHADATAPMRVLLMLVKPIASG